MPPRSEAHRYAVAKLNRALCRGLGPGYSVRIRDAVEIPDWPGSEPPEIDVAVVLDRFYRPIPTAADAILFIEVADDTYDFDRRTRIPYYVKAGVESWIVNLPERLIEYYASPADLELPHGSMYVENDSIEILGLRIPVGYLFDVKVRP